MYVWRVYFGIVFLGKNFEGTDGCETVVYYYCDTRVSDSTIEILVFRDDSFDADVVKEMFLRVECTFVNCITKFYLRENSV